MTTLKKIRDSRLFMILWAVLIVFTVCTGESLITGAESENAILNLISKLSSSASTFNVIDLLAFGGAFLLIKFVLERTKGIDKYGVIVGVLFAFLYIWSFSYKQSNDTSILFANGYQVFMTIFLMIGFSSLFYLVFECIYILFEERVKAPSKETDDGKKVFFISAGVIFICWMFWIVLNYPGSVALDAVGQINQFFTKEYGAHHPPLSSFLMGGFVRLGEKIIDRDFGVFLYLFFQAVTGSLVLGYSILKAYLISGSRKICFIISLFFAVTPIFGLFAQWFEKDMIYSIFTLLFAIFVLEVFQKKSVETKELIGLIVSGLLCCFLRNNGIYAVVPALVLIFVYFRKSGGMKTLIATGGIILSYVLVTSVLYPALHIQPANVREALSIPMQQSARYIRDYGDEVTEEERAALEEFFYFYDYVAEFYDPPCADRVKNIVTTEFNPRSYVKTWIKMGLKHPGVYFDAFMNLNYGYLAPTEQNAEPDITHSDMEQTQAQGIVRYQNETNSQLLSNIVFMNVVYPFWRYLTMPGIYTWITIIMIVLCIRYRAWDGLIILSPNIINILVCLAAPLCNGMRYQLPVVLSIPLLLVWLWKKRQEQLSA
ncbi:MAG: DUF6020 family protein [Lachnospiraceae bacterium]|nr:DUF6020 family protein [Lachnospiraceae bacterium]